MDVKLIFLIKKLTKDVYRTHIEGFVYTKYLIERVSVRGPFMDSNPCLATETFVLMRKLKSFGFREAKMRRVYMSELVVVFSLLVLYIDDILLI